MSEYFNDRVITITRQELMHLVEKRVLAVVDVALSSYYNDVAAYPWLQTFNPTAADFDAVVTTREGNIAFNDNNEDIATTFTVDWLLDKTTSDGDQGSYPFSATTMVSDWYDINSILVDRESPVYGGADAINGPACIWTERDAVSCVGRKLDPDTSNEVAQFNLVSFGNVDITLTNARYYDFQLAISNSDAVTVTSMNTGDINNPRRRDINYVPPFPPANMNLALTVTDEPVDGTYTGLLFSWPVKVTFVGGVFTSAEYCNPSCIPLLLNTDITLVANLTATNTITLATDNGNTIDITGILYDLGYDDELPGWFVTNNWHTQTYVAYSAGDMPGAVSACTAGTNCITLNIGVNTYNDVRAITMVAGKEDPDPGADTQTRPSTLPINYYEVANSSTNDNDYVKLSRSSLFNDQVRIISR